MPKVKQLSFSDLVRRAIKKSAKSRYQIAAESGVSQGILSRFMTGERGLTLETSEKICRVVGLTMRPVEKTKVAS